MARGLVRELESLGRGALVGATGRLFDGDGTWRHRITVPAHKARSARDAIDAWLTLVMVNATVRAGVTGAASGHGHGHGEAIVLRH